MTRVQKIERLASLRSQLLVIIRLLKVKIIMCFSGEQPNKCNNFKSNKIYYTPIGSSFLLPSSFIVVFNRLSSKEGAQKVISKARTTNYFVMSLLASPQYFEVSECCFYRKKPILFSLFNIMGD